MDSTTRNTFRVLIVVLLGIATFVGYTYFKNKNTADNTIQWQTYVSEDFGWSLKYPASWYTYDKGFSYTDENGIKKWYKDDGSVLFSPQPFKSEIPIGSLVLFDGISISYDTTKISYENTLKQNRNLVGFVSEEVTSTFQGRRATKMIFNTQGMDDLPNVSKSTSIVLFIENPHKDFTTLVISLSEKAQQPNEELFDTIISGFEFLE